MNNKKNFIWNFVGLSFYALVSFILLIVVKRINGIDTAGVFTYAFSLTTLLFYAVLYYSRVYQIANYNNNKNFNQFFSFKIISSIVVIVFTVIFSLINGFSKEKILIIAGLLVFRLADAFSETFYGYIQDKGFLYKVGVSYTLKSLIGVIAFIVYDYFTQNVFLSILLLDLINVLFILIYDSKNYKSINSKEKFKIDFSKCGLILAEAFPIFIFSFLNIYLANAQKLTINYFVSDDIQTIFGILIMPATVLSLISGYIIMPFVSTLKNNITKKNYKSFYKISFSIMGVLIACGVLCSIGIYLIGVPVLNIIYDLDLVKYKLLLVIVIIGATFNACAAALSSILILKKKNVMQTIFYLISSVVGTVLNIVLIKYHGINGAVYSYMIIYIILFILYIVYFILIKSKEDK